MKKLIYFTVGPIPTAPELADIAKFEVDGLNVCVRDASKLALLTNQGPSEPADYVANLANAGYPASYPTPAYPRVTSSTVPGPTVGANQKVITSGVEFTAPAATGSYVNGYTPTIVAGAVTAIAGS